jgi:hypothetical protein
MFRKAVIAVLAALSATATTPCFAVEADLTAIRACDLPHARLLARVAANPDVLRPAPLDTPKIKYDGAGKACSNIGLTETYTANHLSGEQSAHISVHIDFANGRRPVLTTRYEGVGTDTRPLAIDEATRAEFPKFYRTIAPVELQKLAMLAVKSFQFRPYDVVGVGTWEKDPANEPNARVLKLPVVLRHDQSSPDKTGFFVASLKSPNNSDDFLAVKAVVDDGDFGCLAVKRSTKFPVVRGMECR